MSLPSGFLPKSQRFQSKSQLNFNSNVPLFYQMLTLRRAIKKDSIVVVVGEKRTGKSYFCGYTGEYLSRMWKVPFGIDDVFFELKGLFKFMFASTDSIAVMEEAGLLLNAQEWSQIEARLTRNMTQTQGFRRNVIFLNLPHFGFLNKSMRLMTNFVIKTIDIGKVEVYRVNVNQAMGSGNLTRVETIEFPTPSKEWVDAYEAKKKLYNDHWLMSDMEIFDLLDGTKKRKKPLQYTKEYDDDGSIIWTLKPQTLTLDL
jgi:hypothetical protein